LPTTQVIPFSIAIKRMSEILLYKAQECVDKLREAQDGIKSEMNELDSNCERTCASIEANFERLQKMVNERKKQLLDFTKRTAEDKRQVLQKQETLLNEQKCEVEAQCSGLPQYQLDVRNLSRKISELSGRLESLGKAQELQENCFIQFEPLDEQAVEQLRDALKQLGQVRTSRTCPAKCQLNVTKCAAHLRTIASLTTFDYAGQAQKIGGEPVDAQLRHVKSARQVDTRTVDLRCGRYEIHFVPDQPGDYELAVRIFDRPVQQFPLRFEASPHINPLCIYGGSGGGSAQFRRPVALAVDKTEARLYVLDTGNSRVKVLSSGSNEATFVALHHLSGQSVLADSACTGLALRTRSSDKKTLFLSNWRNRTIAELDAKTGQLINNISAPQLIEPTSLAVTSADELVVVDNGASSVFIFDTDGRMRLRISANISGMFCLCLEVMCFELESNFCSFSCVNRQRKATVHGSRSYCGRQGRQHHHCRSTNFRLLWSFRQTVASFRMRCERRGRDLRRIDAGRQRQFAWYANGKESQQCSSV
jgi:tripartite motif-containing protein 2/3